MTVVNLHEKQDANEEVKSFIEGLGDLNEGDNALLVVSVGLQDEQAALVNGVMWTRMSRPEINMVIDYTKLAILEGE